MKVNSIRFKIIFLYVLAIGAILAVSRAILYNNFVETLYRDFDGRSMREIRALENTLKAFMDRLGPGDQNFLSAARRVVDFETTQYAGSFSIQEVERVWFPRLDELDVEREYLCVLGPDGEVLARSSNTPERLCAVVSGQGPFITGVPATVEANGVHLRVYRLPFSYKTGETYNLMLVSPIETLIILMRRRFFEMIFTIPLTMLVIGLLGYFLSNRILRPVAEITETARTISYRNLSSRIGIKMIDAELKSLAEAFNDMIARLEGSFGHIADFSMNTAHELKTPLSIIKNQVQLALHRQTDADSCRKTLRDTEEEVSRILRTIDALLFLSKLEYQPEAYRFEELDLNSVLEREYSYTVAKSSPKGIETLYCPPPDKTMISGDPDHLRSLFSNLLSNAVKFSDPGDRITIRVWKAEDEGVVRVSVADTGAGIEERDLPKLFTRFYTTDAERGHGLGLPIARSIARMHGGEITVKSSPGKGSEFTVALPLIHKEA